MTDRELMQYALNTLIVHQDMTRPLQVTGDCIERLQAVLAQPEPQVCCGDYEKCMKACTPRGRWLANQQMTRLEQEKGQFVGGIPEVSQQREWVGLTDTDLMKEFGYTDELLRDTAYRVEQLLKGQNT